MKQWTLSFNFFLNLISVTNKTNFLCTIYSHTLLKMLSVHPIGFSVSDSVFDVVQNCYLDIFSNFFSFVSFWRITLGILFSEWTLMTWLRELENPKLIKKWTQDAKTRLIGHQAPMWQNISHTVCGIQCNAHINAISSVCHTFYATYLMHIDLIYLLQIVGSKMESK